MGLKIAPSDAAEVLDTDEAIEEFMAAAFETDDPAFIAQALRTIARACNIVEAHRGAQGSDPAGLTPWHNLPAPSDRRSRDFGWVGAWGQTRRV